MIAVGLACFLAGLTLGLYLQPHSKQPVYYRHHKDKTPVITTQLQVKPQARPIPPFTLRPSFAQRRAVWEAAHNTKAQMNASIAEQIRQAQEGTLR